MTIKRQPIAPGVVLSSHDDSPGHLCITISDSDRGRFPRSQDLTPEEVDHLVLHALGMTKPVDLGPHAEEDYKAAREAVLAWQATRASRESVRRLDSERDQVMKEAGYARLTYTEAGPALRYLVDQLIAARKAGQQ